MEPVKVVAQILAEELGLDEGRVMLYNQQNTIPKTGLYIALGYSSPSTVLANTNRGRSIANGMVEEQSVSMRHMIQIDVMSPNAEDGSNEARERKEEVVMALMSNRARELSILHGVGLARNPGPIIDTSDIEGLSFQHRYTIQISVTATHHKSKATPYFDKFGGELHPHRKTEPYYETIENKELINE